MEEQVFCSPMLHISRNWVKAKMSFFLERNSVLVLLSHCFQIMKVEGIGIV
ncbi:MAG: hypothetical protein EZS28_054270, partial [Streblomastix strix]